jgi:hypothetical protein
MTVTGVTVTMSSHSPESEGGYTTFSSTLIRTG